MVSFEKVEIVQKRRIVRDAILDVACLVSGIGLIGLIIVMPYFVGNED